MSHPKLTPEQKMAAKIARQIQKDQDQLMTQQQIEQENAEWESTRRSTFLELFYEFTILREIIKDRSDRDYNFQRNFNLELSYDENGFLGKCLRIAGLYYDYANQSSSIHIDTLTKYETKSFKSDLLRIQEEITEYDEKCEREEKERIAKEELKEYALSKLSTEEKRVLGL
jgi:hypothetical protein